MANINKRIGIVITPNWHDYAQKYLGACIASIRVQDYAGENRIYITDNESSPESAALLTRLAPEATLVLNKTNDGFAKGVNDSIRQALADGCEYIAVFNIHTVLEADCLSEMVRVLESDQKIGVVQSFMLLPAEPSPSLSTSHPTTPSGRVLGLQGGNEGRLISSAGNATHYLGFGYCEGYKESYELRVTSYEPREIFYPSGSSMLFRREALEHVGLLDEDYWMYNEDQEIGWRLWLAGWKCVLAPKAILTNHYEFQRSIKKFYWMDRNRILSILICYRWRTLLFIAPAFKLMELGHIFFSLKGGWFRDKLRVWGYFLQPSTWAYIRRARRRNQSLRVISDREIANMITGRIWYQEIDDWKLRLANPFFEAYWKIVRALIIW